MEKFLLSKIISNASGLHEHAYSEIVIDQDYNNPGNILYRFYKCKFTFNPGCSLELNDCEFTDCEFYGFDDDKTTNVLVLRNSSLIFDLKFYLFFSRVEIYDCAICDFHFHFKAHARNLHLQNVVLRGFNFEGSCGSLYLNQFYAFPSVYSHSLIDFFKIFYLYLKGKFNKKFVTGTINLRSSLKYLFNPRPSIWKLVINKNGNIDSAVFDGVKVDPYHLSVRCNVRGSIDLGNAQLIDDWSKLRKEYSGFRLWIIFVMTFFFFLPLWNCNKKLDKKLSDIFKLR